MAPDVLAVLIGSFELIVLLILLTLPVVLTVSLVFLVSKFKTTRLDLRLAEAKLLSDLAQLEKEAASGRQEDVSTSTPRKPGGLSYALQSE
jgi:hypothetical protein